MRLPSSFGTVTSRLLAAALCVALPELGLPQAPGLVRGVVRDSGTGAPIAGAVVQAYTDGRLAVGRTLTDDSGRYRLVPSAAPRSLRVMRIGFRPREVLLAADVADQVVNVGLVVIPTLLERVQVVADPSGCPRTPDAAGAGGLLDQARAALLATIVARTAAPAAIIRIGFERRLDANGERIESQSVRLEQAERAGVSFNAVQPGRDLAERGFSTVENGRRTFFGPDADVLLDDGFTAAYCFGLAPRDTAHPDLAGVSFAAARPQTGRVDIAGALWVDTVARRLSHVEFRYVGLDPLSEGLGAGGHVSFREVVPGIVMIDRWTLRLVGGITSDALARAAPAVARTWEISEVGGELADARWPDGRAWTAPLAALRIAATTTSGEPAVGVPLALVGTEYTAQTDTAGRAEFTRLVPGPYALAVTDPRLATIGLDVPTDFAFVAVRDSVHTARVVLPTAEEFVASLCGLRARPAESLAMVIGRIGEAHGAPAADARWSMARSGDGGWMPVAEGGATGTDGLFAHCRGLRRGESVQIRAWRGRDAPAVLVRVLSDQLSVMPIRLPAAVAGRARGSIAPVHLRGTVRDSSSRASAPGAFVELLGTNRSAITDSAGAFALGALPPGEYTAEIRTPALDSLGAVGRSTFTLTAAGAPVELFVPTARDIVVAMCGPAATGTGIVLGEVRPPPHGAIPARVRVVVVWTDATGETGDPTTRLRWLRTRADSAGRFRLCGVPTGVVLTLRAQLDSGSTVAARPVPTRVDPGRVFAHASIALEQGLVTSAAFSGVVVADTAENALAGSELGVGGAVVELPALGRTAITNGDGTFRLDDIPPGTHRVVVRRAGFTPITADVGFDRNQTVDQRIALGRAAAALAPVAVTDTPGVNPEFAQNRKLGLGRFLTRSELDQHAGRKLGDVLANVPNLGIVAQGGGAHAWIVGKRLPARLAPRIGELPPNAPGATDQAVDARKGCSHVPTGGALNPNCFLTKDDLRDLGIYCPTAAQEMQGMTCACYAQVWVDGRLMNRERPTEPFDLNSIAPEQLEALEWYASASQTPARYSSLNSPCGVMVLWTRRR